MARAAEPVRVAAGILRRGDRILACRRAAGDAFALKWELPGGKLQARESPAEALVRELHEELAIHAQPGPEVERRTHTYPGRPPVHLHFFEVLRFDGEPRNQEFDTIRWAAPTELLDLDWLEADLPLVQRLTAAAGRPLPPRRAEDFR